MSYLTEKRECVICHNFFTPKAPKQITCSEKCRCINNGTRRKIYSHNHYEEYHVYQKLTCNICNNKIERNGIDSTHYHYDCVCQEAIKEIKRGYGVHNSDAVKRAANVFGLSMTELREMI